MLNQEFYTIDDLNVGEEVIIVVEEAQENGEGYSSGDVVIQTPSHNVFHRVYSAAVNHDGNFFVYADGSGKPHVNVARKTIHREIPLGVYSSNLELCYKLKV